MKRIFTLLLFAVVVKKGNCQVLLNELYTDPGSGKHEFFELYNNSTSSTSFSTDNLTMVTYFNISGTKGFYVMDFPNLTVAQRGYFVGASALPFNYQGTSNSTAADFSWNSASFTSNNGYIRKWVLGTLNLLDGNLFYDQAAVPVNFNDFFYRITGTGASYSVFLYNNGQLINSFIGGTGGMTTVTNEITNMPNLYVDMSGSSPDFTINFSGYGSIPVENCTSDAGSDNGYIREFDGACASWKKSSSSVQHTPHASNGTLIGASQGSVAVAVATWMGNAASGSIVYNDIVSAPSSYFPIELQVYTDRGSLYGKLDAGDVYVQSNTETVVSQGPFYTKFFPYDANVLIAVKTNAGCYDKILFVPNTIVLATQLITFTGNKNNQHILVNWEVANNESVDRFELQRSFDGVNFSTIALVLPFENAGKAQYNYKDDAAERSVMYRIRIFNKSGKVDYSNTLSFASEKKDNHALHVINNPAVNSINFSYKSINNGAASVEVLDITGRLMLHETIRITKGENLFSLPLSSAFRSGNYIISVSDGTQRSTEKFMCR